LTFTCQALLACYVSCLFLYIPQKSSWLFLSSVGDVVFV
jgi:hypothetical protein